MMNVVMVVNCDDDGGSDVVYDSGQFGWWCPSDGKNNGKGDI
jgi:hypothetical protein